MDRLHHADHFILCGNVVLLDNLFYIFEIGQALVGTGWQDFPDPKLGITNCSFGAAGYSSRSLAIINWLRVHSLLPLDAHHDLLIV